MAIFNSYVTNDQRVGQPKVTHEKAKPTETHLEVQSE